MLLAYNADLLPKVRMLGQIHYSTPWSHFNRCSHEYIMYVIKSGDMYIREGIAQFHLTHGDFLVLEPGLYHEGYKPATCEYYYAHFMHPDIFHVDDDAEALAMLEEKRRKSLISYNLDEADPTDSITYLPKHFHLAGDEFKAVLHTAVECYVAREEHYKRRASAYIHSFLLNVAHEHLLSHNQSERKNINRSEIVVEDLLHYLQHNYAKRITSEDIVRKYDINFDYLNKVFSSLTGSPIFTYINLLRIYNAKQLIATTDLKFSEVGYLVGIEDRYYFSKLFKKITGITPTDYYRKARNL